MKYIQNFEKFINEKKMNIEDIRFEIENIDDIKKQIKIIYLVVFQKEKFLKNKLKH